MVSAIRLFLRESIKGAIFYPRAWSLRRTVRCFSRWRRSQDISLFETNLPWITFDACEFLQKIIRSNWTVFEYGMGGSTTFFLSRVHNLHSVESSSEWYNKVVDQIKNSKDVGKWTSFFEIASLASRPVEEQSKSEPGSYISSDGFDYKKYVEVISQYPDGYFDCVFIDGRARPSCLIKSRFKIRPGGWLILDDAERSHYQPACDVLEALKWKRWSFYGPGPACNIFWMTTFWQKPKN